MTWSGLGEVTRAELGRLSTEHRFHHVMEIVQARLGTHHMFTSIQFALLGTYLAFDPNGNYVPDAAMSLKIVKFRLDKATV